MKLGVDGATEEHVMRLSFLCALLSTAYVRENYPSHFCRPRADIMVDSVTKDVFRQFVLMII